MITRKEFLEIGNKLGLHVDMTEQALLILNTIEEPMYNSIRAAELNNDGIAIYKLKRNFKLENDGTITESYMPNDVAKTDNIEILEKGLMTLIDTTKAFKKTIRMAKIAEL